MMDVIETGIAETEIEIEIATETTVTKVGVEVALQSIDHGGVFHQEGDPSRLLRQGPPHAANLRPLVDAHPLPMHPGDGHSPPQSQIAISVKRSV